jgi:hypothetical protein
MTADPGRVLLHVGFAMAGTGYLRNFESAIDALLRRGHRVTLLAEHRGANAAIIERLGRHSGFEIRVTPAVRSRWDALGLRMRSARDYWRYLEPRYASAPALKERVGPLAPPRVLRLDTAKPRLRRLVSGITGGLEKRLPVPPPYVEEMKAVRPDVLLVTPLIYLGSSQVQWIRAGRKLGVPTAFCVHSWDNLTTKGVLQDTPSAVIVWNAAQCDEAAEEHGVDRALCHVTGAPAFDHWFSMRPMLTREEFFDKVGLPARAPLILYLCSSRFIARNEAKWVERWIKALRCAADERVRTASILIRPHPQNAKQWGRWTSPDPAVQLFPKSGELPIGDDERANYFHSMLYADVIVGLNTSALIEAAIFGKPVLSVAEAKGAEYRETLHFGHLEKGLLIVARDHREHVRQIAEALRSPGFSDRCRQFVEEFVRPLGRDHSAGEHMADAVEKLARTGRGTRQQRNGS